MIHWWIIYRKGEPIPNKLKFDGWEEYGEDDPPIYYWIKYRQGEDIPKDMKYSGWENF